MPDDAPGYMPADAPGYTPADALEYTPTPGYTAADAPGHPSARARESRSASAREQPPVRRRAARQRHRGFMLAALSLALVGLVAAVVGLVTQLMPRTFSAAQKQQIIAWEMGKRWRTWAAGEIFPSTVRYRVPGSTLGGAEGLDLVAHRIGIVRQTSCREATDPSVARILDQHGCLAVLRASYDDATQSLAVTVGVAVLPGPAAAQATLRALPGRSGHGPRPGVRAVPFPRTLVARFGNRQRQLSWQRASGPYLVFATVGYADGRRRVREAANLYATAEMLGLESGVGGSVAAHIGAAPPPPQCPGGPAC